MDQADEINHRAGHQEKRDAACVDSGRAGDVDEAAERRPGDDRRLSRRGVACQRTWKQSARHEQRKQCRHRRHLKCPRSAHDENQHEDQALGDPALIAAERESAGGERLDDHARLQDATSIETVGDVSCRQHQHKRWNELHESDKAKIERAVRQRIDLPANADGQHLIGHCRGRAREPEAGEGAMAKRRYVRGAHRA